MLQNKLDSTEADLEAARSAEKLHEQEETSWRKARKTLESDLDTAESQLDKTKVKLETEKKTRYGLTMSCMYYLKRSFTTSIKRGYGFLHDNLPQTLSLLL